MTLDNEPTTDKGDNLTTWRPPVSCMRLVPRDNNHAYVWWSLLADDVIAARDGLGRLGPATHLVLRLRTWDGTGPARSSDITIERWTGQRYVVAGPRQSWMQASIGVSTQEAGTFIPIARSNRLTLGGRPEPIAWRQPWQPPEIGLPKPPEIGTADEIFNLEPLPLRHEDDSVAPKSEPSVADSSLEDLSSEDASSDDSGDVLNGSFDGDSSTF